MIYKKFQDMELSALGFGLMRLPVIDKQEGRIDEEKAREMLACCMENGVNYYDTAWGYHAEQSELTAGRLLKEYPRDSFYLATKFPGYDPANITKGREIFERQLEKCQVDYFDFYLFHNVSSINIDAYLDDEKNGLYSYLMEQKKNGRIRHLGFSAHGDYEIVKRFLDAYGKDMEFCQIQLNWIDYEFQDAKHRIELLNEYGIPIWVMEPLRGGRLAKIPEKYEQKLRAMRPDESIPEWGFRFLQTIPNIVVTLSGMSSMKHVEDNIAVFETEQPLTAREWDCLMEIADEMKEEMTVPCTACHYCTSECPQELDIPGLLQIYNDQALTGRRLVIPDWMLEPVPKEKWPGECIGCGSCEKVCPQGIKISEVMARFRDSIVPS